MCRRPKKRGDAAVEKRRTTASIEIVERKKRFFCSPPRPVPRCFGFRSLDNYNRNVLLTNPDALESLRRASLVGYRAGIQALDIFPFLFFGFAFALLRAPSFLMLFPSPFDRGLRGLICAFQYRKHPRLPLCNIRCRSRVSKGKRTGARVRGDPLRSTSFSTHQSRKLF